MRNSYYAVFRGFMPALKGNLARIMAVKYGLRQVEIAKLVGVTQAEISKYVSGKQPKYSAVAFDQKKIDMIIRNMLEHKEHEAQRVVCSMCPKGASLSCSLMTR